jgi:hypothetical protein
VADEARAAALAATQAETAALEAHAQLRSLLVERDEQAKKHRAAILEAHRVLYVDTMTRLIDRECDRLKTAQATPEKLRTVSERFYRETFPELLVRALTPVVRVHLAAVGSQDDAEDMARDLADQHVEGSRRAVLAVLDEGDGYREALGRLLVKWESERVTQMATALMQRELDHVV